LPPIHHWHPLTTPPEVEAAVLTLSLAHPAWGCNKLSDWLKLEGTSLSAPTIQRILGDNGMSSRYDRWLKLETKHAEEGIELTAEQVKFLEKQNPAFRERHVESSQPGELLTQDSYTVGSIKGVGRIWLHAVVDTYPSYAFGFLHTTRKPEAAVAVVHNDVLPFYQERAIAIDTILTDNGREFCGTDTHPFELYLALNDIEQHWTKVGRPQSNGFVERLSRASSSNWLSAARCTPPLTSCRLTSTTGSSTTIPNARIRATATWAGVPLTPSASSWNSNRTWENQQQQKSFQKPILYGTMLESTHCGHTPGKGYYLRMDLNSCYGAENRVNPIERRLDWNTAGFHILQRYLADAPCHEPHVLTKNHFFGVTPQRLITAIHQVPTSINYAVRELPTASASVQSDLLRCFLEIDVIY
jgi:transposase InsO family protein